MMKQVNKPAGRMSNRDVSRSSARRGFTLIELLVVIAIIAILAIVAILTLNPAELLRQSRDSNRISDVGTLRTAIALYLVDVQSPSIGSSTRCYVSSVSSNVTSSSNCGYFSGGYTLTDTSDTQSNYRNVDGTGWLPVNFKSISTGAPFGQLPLDPLNNLSYFYAFASTSTSGGLFEMETSMESKKYGYQGSNDVVSTDGGNNTSSYEIGSTYVF